MPDWIEQVPARENLVASRLWAPRRHTFFNLQHALIAVQLSPGCSTPLSRKVDTQDAVIPLELLSFRWETALRPPGQLYGRRDFQAAGHR